jgi:type II secretory pathway pseudopilin PulG
MKARGMALVSGLVVLAAISLLALTAAGGMALQQHQSANFLDRLRAEANADAALAAARAWLDSRADTDRQFDCVTGCFLPDEVRPPGELPRGPEFLPGAWWSRNAADAARDPLTRSLVPIGGAGVGEAHWLIEEIHFEALDPGQDGDAPRGVGYYRLLGRGSGRHARSVAVAEAIVARPWQGTYEPAWFPPERSLGDFCNQFEDSVPCGVLSWRMRR